MSSVGLHWIIIKPPPTHPPFPHLPPKSANKSYTVVMPLSAPLICPGSVLPREWSPISFRCYLRALEPAPVFFPVSLPTALKRATLQPSLCNRRPDPPLCLRPGHRLSGLLFPSPGSSFSYHPICETALILSSRPQTLFSALPQSFVLL